MRLVSLALENFFSHEDSFIDFQNVDSICLLMGEIASNERSSNGSGKSAFIEAILYSLYEKNRLTESKNGTLNDMVRWNSNGKMKVTLKFRIGEVLYRIMRTRDNNKNKGTTTFEIYSNKKWIDKSDTKKRNTNIEIEKAIGIDYDTFCSSICFQPKDVDRFIMATESERKAIIKNLLQLDRYDEYKFEARVKAKMYDDEIKAIDKQLEVVNINAMDVSVKEDQIKKVETKIGILEQEKSAIHSQLEKLKKQQILFNERVEKRVALTNQIKDRTTSIQRLKNYIQQSTSKREEYEKVYQSRKIEFKELRDKFEKIKDQFTIERAEILKDGKAADKRLKQSEKDLEESSRLFHKLQGEVENIEKNIKEVNDLSAPRCPTCFVENTDATRANSLKFLEAHLSLVKEKATVAKQRHQTDKQTVETNKKLLEEVKDRLVEYSKWAKERAYLGDTLKRLKETITEAKIIVEDQVSMIKENKSMLEGYKKEVGELEKQVKGIKVDLEAFEELNKQVTQKAMKYSDSNRLLAEVQVEKGQLQVELKQYLASLDKVKHYRKQRENLVKEKFYYTHLTKIFGSEIPSLIIENTCYELSQEANKVLSKISNDSIEFVTQRLNQDGSTKECFEIEITRPNVERPILIDALSNGQKFRVMFAIRIALSRLLVRRRSSATMDFLFYDECFASLDEKGIDDVIDIFKYLREEFAHQLIITHRSDLKERFGDNVIVVQQDLNGVSKVVV